MREWRQTEREKRWSVSWNASSRLRNFVPASYAHLGNQSPARNLYWASVKGTTERRPILTSGESAKSFLDLISPNVMGLGSGGIHRDDGRSADGTLAVAGFVDDQFVAGLHPSKILHGDGIRDAVPNSDFVALKIGERVCGGFGFQEIEGRHEFHPCGSGPPFYMRHSERRTDRNVCPTRRSVRGWRRRRDCCGRRCRLQWWRGT